MSKGLYIVAGFIELNGEIVAQIKPQLNPTLHQELREAIELVNNYTDLTNELEDITGELEEAKTKLKLLKKIID